MLISKIVKVKSSKYYKELGYNIDDRYIYIKVEDLVKGSRSIVEASCDYCDNIKEITYKEYNKNISKGGKYSCSIKCGSLKAKESNLEKYGVDSVFKLDSVKSKIKETILEKYGVDHISKSKDIGDKKSQKMKEQSSEVSDRIKKYMNNLSESEKNDINKKRFETNLSKYGKGYISQVDEIKDRIKDTNLKKWGGYTYQSPILMNKVKNTNLEKFGFEYPSKNKDVKNKSYLTNIERYGYKSPSMNDDIKDKAKETNLKRYGVENIMFIPSVVKNLNDRFYEKWGVNSYFKTEEFKNNYIRYINNNISEFNCDCSESHLFQISSINFHNRNNSNLPLCTICYPIDENSSIKEIEIRNYIGSIYSGKIISSYRDGLEIDIYLPELKLGFEFNGLYWHSDKYKERNYHIDKTNYFKEKGIRIIHIWEDDWDGKKEIIKSQIINWIGLSSNKIWARNCSIGIVNKLDYKNFLDNNHIQGFIRSSIRIGLFHKGELVSLMTFDNLEGRKKMEEGGWNLSRFCNKLNINVLGGASKLLKHFIKEWKPIRIISYADLDWSQGDLYYKLGFELSTISKPDYKYINGKRLNKQKFTKNKLIKLGYDISKTESQITNEIGLSKVWGCGQLKFELLLNK